MLGTKKAPKARQNGTASLNGQPSGDTCVISSGTVIEGKFECSDNVRLDGTVLGDVICDKRLVMGKSGRIEGTLTAEDAILQGTVKGETKITNSLHLESTAKIDGDIHAKTMRVDEGATYNGQCSIG